MTHTPVYHYAPGTTFRWLESRACRRAFAGWAGRRASNEIRARAQLAMIGWIPLATLDDFDRASTWIESLDPDSLALRHLVDVLFVDWIDSDDEHEQFHAWADPDHVGVRPLCGGCWT